LYIIKEGEVECELQGKVIRTLGNGEFFGELSILNDCSRTMNVNARKNSTVFSISIDTLKNLAGEKYKEALILNLIKNILQKSSIIDQTNIKLIDEIFDRFSVKLYQNKEIVLKKGYQIKSNVIFIIEGNILYSNNQEICGKRGEILFEKDVITASKEQYELLKI
jgi:CRP-like cAMP-binding protein